MGCLAGARTLVARLKAQGHVRRMTRGFRFDPMEVRHEDRHPSSDDCIAAPMILLPLAAASAGPYVVTAVHQASGTPKEHPRIRHAGAALDGSRGDLVGADPSGPGASSARVRP